MTIDNKIEKKMSEASALVCLLLATVQVAGKNTQDISLTWLVNFSINQTAQFG